MSRLEVHDVKRNGDLGCGADREGRAQSANRSAYAFRPAARQDLPLLQRWLSTPEVGRWWGDPQEKAALLQEDLEEPAMVMRIVSFANCPFAYAQDYPVHA